MTRQNEEEALIQMFDRRCFATRLNLQHIIGHEIAAAMRMGKAAARIKPIPALGFERQKVMAKIKMDRNAFTIGPIHIGIEKDT